MGRVYIYLRTWMVDFDGINVGKYNETFIECMVYWVYLLTFG